MLNHPIRIQAFMRNLITFLRKNSVRLLFGFLATLFLGLNTLGITHQPIIDRLNLAIYDSKVNFSMPKKMAQGIVIVDVDEKSLKEQGRWPWNRKTLANLTYQLFNQYQVDIVGFDIIFAEEDDSSGLKNLERIRNEYLKENKSFNATLDSVRASLDYDRLFSESLKNRKTVLGYYFNQSETGASVGNLPKPIFDREYFNGLDIGAIQNKSFAANLPILQEAAKDAGYFNFLPDQDGVLRKIPMLMEFNGEYYASLSLSIAKLALNAKQIEPEMAIDTSDKNQSKMYASIQSLELNQHKIPLDENLSALIPYSGHKGSFKYISATDVLNKKARIEDLKGAIVLIGTTAPGLLDMRTSPTDAVYPGVEAHANMIHGILNNSIKQYPSFSPALEFSLVILLGLTLTLTLPRLNPTLSSTITLAILALLISTDFYLWQYQNISINNASLYVAVISIYLFNMAIGFFSESRGKKQLAGMFGQYIPPQLVKEMAKNPDNYKLDSKNQTLTVLFSDVRSFTTISEGLDPKALSELMNQYLTPMTRLIHETGGTIDKYMGDAIMAFWGAPIEEKNHAELALETAIRMIKELDVINDQFFESGWPRIAIGIGLNTGEMTVGNMGSTFRMAYTVMGDAVNLGSRLEGLTKEYGVSIIVSEFTKDQIPDYAFRELDLVRVKGKEKPVAIFEPIGEQGKISKSIEDELETYAEALRYFRNQHWTKAKQIFNILVKQHERKLYQIYLERIDYYFKNPPPPDWDGAFTFKTK